MSRASEVIENINRIMSQFEPDKLDDIDPILESPEGEEDESEDVADKPLVGVDQFLSDFGANSDAEESVEDDNAADSDDIVDDTEGIGEEVKFSDLKELWAELKEMGLDDEKKLKGMFGRAKELAKEQGKADDKKTIVGIVQSFLKAK